jgi:hypothetical protein
MVKGNSSSCMLTGISLETLVMIENIYDMFTSQNTIWMWWIFMEWVQMTIYKRKEDIVVPLWYYSLAWIEQNCKIIAQIPEFWLVT